MTGWVVELGLVVISFLLGSIPFGLLVAKIYGVDNLRGQGSGNIGATNVARVIGFWPAGFITFLLDAFKGLLIVAPAKFGWVSEGILPNSNTFLWMVGVAAMLGHCFSPWLRFNGGKGVATTFGVIGLLAPLSGLVGGAVFGLTYLATRVGAAGSLLGLIAAISVHRIFYPYEPSMVLFGLMVLIAIYRHESNLDGLLAGTGKAESPDANPSL